MPLSSKIDVPTGNVLEKRNTLKRNLIFPGHFRTIDSFLDEGFWASHFATPPSQFAHFHVKTLKTIRFFDVCWSNSAETITIHRFFVPKSSIRPMAGFPHDPFIPRLEMTTIPHDPFIPRLDMPKIPHNPFIPRCP